jgi:hypothetical protein
MNTVLDDSLVALLLLISAGYAVSSLGPRSLRRRLLAVISRVLARASAVPGFRHISQRLAAASTGKGQGACGGCDSCESEQSGAEKSSPPAAEIRVPLGRVGRRG